MTDPTQGSTERAADRAWAAFEAEARALLAVVPEEMTAEQLDRLEAISDAFIHLVGFVESMQPRETARVDSRLLDELARRRERRRERVVDHATGSSDRALSEADRLVLRRRILEGLHASRLRVREEGSPFRRRVRPPIVPTPALLRELEQSYRAIELPELGVAAGAGRELWSVECDTTIDVPEDLPRAPYLALAVTGDSMEPLLHSGDTVLVRVEERAMPRTVIVARVPDHGYVVKEVAAVTADGLELRSLNPAFPSVRVPHVAGAVLGTVLLRWCPHGAGAYKHELSR